MKLKKGVLITHPINDYRGISPIHDQNGHGPQNYIPISSQTPILYYLNDGKFLFYFGETSTGNSLNDREDKEYLFRTRRSNTGNYLNLTQDLAKTYTRQAFNQERLLNAIKEELKRKRRKSIPEKRAIEMGASITSEGENKEFYGANNRRMVAKGLLYELMLGNALTKKGLDKLVLK